MWKNGLWARMIRGLATAVGAVAGLYGGWSPVLTVLVVMMGIDYATGVLVAWLGRSNKSESGGLSSKAGFAGLARKGVVMLIVLLATLLDRAIGNASTVFQSAAAFYYVANEGLSVLENAGLLGVPVPGRVRQALEVLREQGDREDESDTNR